MNARAGSAMKVTTVRFGADLWGLLEAEAAHAGVSTSQYIREAALARAVAAAATRGEGPFELLAGAVREVMQHEPLVSRRAEAERALATLTRLIAAETCSDAGGAVAQSQQAVRHATHVAERSDALRRR